MNTTDDELIGLANGLFGPIPWRVIEPAEATAAERALEELRELLDLPSHATPGAVVAAVRALHTQRHVLAERLDCIASLASR